MVKNSARNRSQHQVCAEINLSSMHLNMSSTPSGRRGGEESARNSSRHQSVQEVDKDSMHAQFVSHTFRA